MRWRTVFVLWMAAALAVAAARLGGDAERAGTGGGGGPRPLLDELGVPADAITTATAVEIAVAGEPAARFERSAAGSWSQVAPFTHPVQRFSVEETLRALLAVMVQTESDPEDAARTGGPDDAAAGLAPPLAVLRIESGAAPARSFALGRSLYGGRAFLAAEGRRFVVDRGIHARLLEADRREWLDRRIFVDVASVDADAIEIEAAGQRTRLERDRRVWRMLEPVRTRVDDFARDELLEALAGATSAGFVLELDRDAESRRRTLASLGLDPPQGRVTVRARTPEGVEVERTLRVGGRTGAGTQDRFGLVDGRPVVVRLPASLLARVFRRPETLADPTGTAVRPADVARVEIRRSDGDDDVLLARDLDAWTIASEDGPRPADAETADTLLRLLTGARAEGLELADHPREHEVATVILYGFDGRPRDTVRIARLPDGRWSLENGDRLLRLFSPSFTLPLERSDFAI